MTVFQDVNLTDGTSFVPDFISQTLGYAAGGGINIAGVVLFFGILSIVYMASSRYLFGLGFTGTSFIGVILSGIMIKLGWLPPGIFVLSIVLFVIGLIISAINIDR
jgi:hypothetical protein